MKIIVGLGNYGDKYAYTFHNLGFLTAECIAERLGAKFKKRECDSLTAHAFALGEEIIVAKPLTYMNLSGVAVKQLLQKNKADLDALIVVYDDVDIPACDIRIRQKGSAGTHNGMRNIIENIKSGDFYRVRIGIGRPDEGISLADYVLSEIPRGSRESYYAAINRAADQIIAYITNK